MTVAREERSGTARDSLVAGGGTAVSRLTGVLRVVMVGAVLGPTTFGDAFQLTNSLPNLIYYGFLAGSLFSSLLVPALVRHVDMGDPLATARVSGGFLGISWLAMLALLPVALIVVPQLMGGLTPEDPGAAARQTDQARLLLLLMSPQVFLYAVAGASASVLNAHRRFALAAVAPAVENVAVIGVLATVWAVYGSGGGAATGPSAGEVLLLGLGSTGAVAAHAGLQWVGARAQGVPVRPRAGWRDPDVLPVVRRAVRSVLQAALLAFQMLVLLLLAGRAAGGTVALQMVFNFYYLPIALVATPVGLAVIPRLSRLHQDQQAEQFRATYREGLALALFFACPAAAGYVLLAEPIAQVVTVGAMGSGAGAALVAAPLAAIALGLVGQTAFYLSLQASYARQDTRTPLVSMLLQAAVCVSAALTTLSLPGERALTFLAAAYAVGALAGGLHLTRAVGASCGLPVQRLMPLAARLSLGTVVMALAVLGVASRVGPRLDGPAASVLVLLLGAVVGTVTFLAVQLALRSPELTALRSAVRRGHVGDPVVEESVP